MNSITDEERQKFNKLIAEWVTAGQLHITPRLDCYGQPKQEELDLCFEFPAGGERIGNDGSGSFTWNDIFQIAKSQGLIS